MSIQRRNTIVRGPAIVKVTSYTAPLTQNGAPVAHTYTFRTKSDVVFTPETQVFDVESSELGRIDQRASELLNTVVFTPVGVVDADGIGILWPHLAKLPGQSLFGDYDMEVEVVPVAGGRGVKLWNVAVTKMPDIFISSTKTQIGEVTLRGIIDDDYDWGQDNHVSFSDWLAPTLAAVSPSTIPTTPAAVSWGDMEDIKTKDGVTISFEMSTQDETEDEVGVYDITLTDLKATAKFTPVAGFDLDALVEILHNGDGQERGSSVFRADLTATSLQQYALDVTVFSAALLSAPMTYGREAGRFGELTFEGLRGTGNAVATVERKNSVRPTPNGKTEPEGDGEGEGGEGSGAGEGSGTGT